MSETFHQGTCDDQMQHSCPINVREFKGCTEHFDHEGVYECVRVSRSVHSSMINVGAMLLRCSITFVPTLIPQRQREEEVSAWSVLLHCLQQNTTARIDASQLG